MLHYVAKCRALVVILSNGSMTSILQLHTIVEPFGLPTYANRGHERSLSVGQNQWYDFGVGEFTTHFGLFLVGIGMFTGGTIWMLTHGHLGSWRLSLRGIRV